MPRIGPDGNDPHVALVLAGCSFRTGAVLILHTATLSPDSVCLLRVTLRWVVFHRVNRYFNLFFYTCSFGLFAPPSNQVFTFPTETTCAASGAARMFSFVAIPKAKAANRRCITPTIRSPT